MFKISPDPFIAMTLTAPLPLRERKKGRGGLVIEGDKAISPFEKGGLRGI
jgi:hypothetical protein